MPNVVAQASVVAFLLQVKAAVSSGSWTYVPRTDTRNTLAHYGWLPSHLANALMSLVVSDYFNGPVPDINPGFCGDIWEFGPVINTSSGNITFYVKLKVRNVSGNDQVVVISFHPAKTAIMYPYP